MHNNLHEYDRIVDNIISSNLNIDIGIENFTTLLYDCAFNAYGQTRTYFNSKKTPGRKYNSPWFNNECKVARRSYMRAKRLFYDDRSTDNRAVFLTSKTQYNKTKRTAKHSFNMRQRENFRRLFIFFISFQNF